MDPPLSATITFVVATTFSPGPNNLVSASIGMAAGYRRALPFTIGSGSGFAIVMLLCAGAATWVLDAVPAVEPVLKYVGAGYILWLAFSLWAGRESFGTGDDRPVPRGWLAGFALQFANPKVAVYGLMLYSTFLARRGEYPLFLGVSAVVLACVSFTSVTVWALAGAAIRRRLTSARARTIAAAVLALALVYSALELVLVGSR